MKPIKQNTIIVSSKKAKKEKYTIGEISNALNLSFQIERSDSMPFILHLVREKFQEQPDIFEIYRDEFEKFIINLRNTSYDALDIQNTQNFLSKPGIKRHAKTLIDDLESKKISEDVIEINKVVGDIDEFESKNIKALKTNKQFKNKIAYLIKSSKLSLHEIFDRDNKIQGLVNNKKFSKQKASNLIDKGIFEEITTLVAEEIFRESELSEKPQDKLVKTFASEIQNEKLKYIEGANAAINELKKKHFNLFNKQFKKISDYNKTIYAEKIKGKDTKALVEFAVKSSALTSTQESAQNLIIDNLLLILLTLNKEVFKKTFEEIKLIQKNAEKEVIVRDALVNIANETLPPELSRQKNETSEALILRIISETKKALEIFEINNGIEKPIKVVVTEFIKSLNTKKQELKTSTIDNENIIKSIDVIDTCVRDIYHQIVSSEIEENIRFYKGHSGFGATPQKEEETIISAFHESNLDDLIKASPSLVDIIKDTRKNVFNYSETLFKGFKEQIFGLLDKADNMEKKLKEFLDEQEQELITVNEQIEKIKDEEKKEEYLELYNKIYAENYYPVADKTTLYHNYTVLSAGKFYLINSLISHTPNEKLPEDLKNEIEKFVDPSVLEYVLSPEILSTLKNDLQKKIKEIGNNSIPAETLKQLPRDLQIKIKKLKNDLITTYVSPKILKDLILNFITDKNNQPEENETENNTPQSSDKRFDINKIIEVLATLSVNSELDTEDRVEYEKTEHGQIKRLHLKITKYLDNEEAPPPVPKKNPKVKEESKSKKNKINSQQNLTPVNRPIPQIIVKEDLNAKGVKSKQISSTISTTMEAVSTENKNQSSTLHRTITTTKIANSKNKNIDNNPSIKDLNKNNHTSKTLSSLKAFVDNKTGQQDVAELWDALNGSFYEDRVFESKSVGNNVEIISNSAIIKPTVSNDNIDISIQDAFESTQEISGSGDIKKVNDDDRDSICDNPNEYYEIILNETNPANHQDNNKKLLVKYIFDSEKKCYTKKFSNEQGEWQDVLGNELSKSGRNLTKTFTTEHVKEELFKNKVDIISAAKLEKKTIKTRIHLVDEQSTFTSYIPRSEIIGGNNVKKTNRLNNSPITIDGKSFEITSYVVHHEESANSGHYTTVFLASDGMWYEANDNKVETVGMDDETQIDNETKKVTTTYKIQKEKLESILRNCVLVNYSSESARHPINLPSIDKISGTENAIKIGKDQYANRCFINATLVHATTLLESSKKLITQPEITKAQIECAVKIVDNESNIDDSFKELFDIIKKYPIKIQASIIENTIIKIKSLDEKNAISIQAKINGSETIMNLLQSLEVATDYDDPDLDTAHQISMESDAIKNLESLQDKKDPNERANKREEFLQSWSANPAELKPKIAKKIQTTEGLKKEFANLKLDNRKLDNSKKLTNLKVYPALDNDKKDPNETSNKREKFLQVESDNPKKPQQKPANKQLYSFKKITNFISSGINKLFSKKPKSNKDTIIKKAIENIVDIKSPEYTNQSISGRRASSFDANDKLVNDLLKEGLTVSKEEAAKLVKSLSDGLNSKAKDEAFPKINNLLLHKEDIIEYLSERQNMGKEELEEKNKVPSTEPWNAKKNIDPKDAKNIYLALKQATDGADSPDKLLRFKVELCITQIFNDALYQASEKELEELEGKFIDIMQHIFRGITGYEEKLETEDNREYFNKLMNNAASFFANEDYENKSNILKATPAVLSELYKTFSKIDIPLKLKKINGPKNTTDDLLKMAQFFSDNHTQERVYTDREEVVILEQLLKNIDPQFKTTALTLGIKLIEKSAKSDIEKEDVNKIKTVRGNFNDIINNSKITYKEKAYELSKIIEDYGIETKSHSNNAEIVQEKCFKISFWIHESIIKILDDKNLSEEKGNFEDQFDVEKEPSTETKDIITLLQESAKTKDEKSVVSNIKMAFDGFDEITASKINNEEKANKLSDLIETLKIDHRFKQPAQITEQTIHEQSLDIEKWMFEGIKKCSNLRDITDKFTKRFTLNEDTTDTILQELDKYKDINLLINDAASQGKTRATPFLIELLKKLATTTDAKESISKIANARLAILNTSCTAEEKSKLLSETIKKLEINNRYSELNYGIFEKSYDIQAWILKEVYLLLESHKEVIENYLKEDETVSSPKNDDKTKESSNMRVSLDKKNETKELILQIQVMNSDYDLLKSWEKSLKTKEQEMLAFQIRSLPDLLAETPNLQNIKFELLKLFFSKPDLALKWSKIIERKTDLSECLEDLLNFCKLPEKGIKKDIHDEGKYSLLISSITSLKDAVDEIKNKEIDQNIKNLRDQFIDMIKKCETFEEEVLGAEEYGWERSKYSLPNFSKYFSIKRGNEKILYYFLPNFPKSNIKEKESEIKKLESGIYEQLKEYYTPEVQTIDNEKLESFFGNILEKVKKLESAKNSSTTNAVPINLIEDHHELKVAKITSKPQPPIKTQLPIMTIISEDEDLESNADAEFVGQGNDNLSEILGKFISKNFGKDFIETEYKESKEIDNKLKNLRDDFVQQIKEYKKNHQTFPGNIDTIESKNYETLSNCFSDFCTYDVIKYDLKSAPLLQKILVYIRKLEADKDLLSSEKITYTKKEYTINIEGLENVGHNYVDNNLENDKKSVNISTTVIKEAINIIPLPIDEDTLKENESELKQKNINKTAVSDTSTLSTSTNTTTLPSSPTPKSTIKHPHSQQVNTIKNDKEITEYVKKFLSGEFEYDPKSESKENKIIGKLLANLHHDNDEFEEKPKTPYRGTGLNIDYSATEVKIKAVFPSEFSRFIQIDPATKKPLNNADNFQVDSLKDNFITEISTDNGITWKKIGKDITVQKALKLFRDPYSNSVQFKVQHGKKGVERIIQCQKQLFINSNHNVGYGKDFSRKFLTDDVGNVLNERAIKESDINQYSIKKIFGDNFIKECNELIAIEKSKQQSASQAQ